MKQEKHGLVTLNIRYFEKVRNVEIFDLDKYKKLS